jgi:dihydrolipoamide dehydrogenase
MAENYDVIIIGSGPGGYVAAVRPPARPQDGDRRARASRRHLPELGLHPDQGAAALGRGLHYCRAFQGLRPRWTARSSFDDIAAVVARSRGVSLRLNGGVGFLMKKNKVDVIWGEAKITKPGEVVVSKTAKKPDGAAERRCRKASRARAPTPPSTSSSRPARGPRALPGIEPDGKLIWTYFEAMVPQEMPKSLLVMGSGAIGIEFASFYRTMGVEVTVVELLPQVMPVEDAEVTKIRPQAASRSRA